MDVVAGGAPVNFTNDQARIAIQTGQYISQGDTIIQHAQDPLPQLPCAAEAAFNSYTKQHERTCLPDTRVDLLGEIYSWADGRDGRDGQHIFWLSGLAGTGKSTIARTVARHYFDERKLGASFFFSRGNGDLGHAGKFVTSIAVQLAHNLPASRRHICDAITARSDIASHSLRDQWHHLVLGPLSKLNDSDCHSSYALVVDALDECDNDNNIRIIVQLLAEARSLEKVRLRVLLTSRPDISVRHEFGKVPDAERKDFVLHSISPPIVDRDITLFLEFELRLIGEEGCLDPNWPGPEIIKRLVYSASGLFIWAATACRFVREGFLAEERLRTLVEGGTSTASSSPEAHLNNIYITVLQNSVRPGFTAQETDQFCSILRDVLGCIVVLFSLLSSQSLSKLLLIPKQKVDRMLNDLHAIIDIPKEQNYPVRLHHPSFRDFLLDKERCRDLNFWVNEKQVHQRLKDNCIKLMLSSLKQYICGVDAPGATVTEVHKDQIEHHLPPELQYACLYWVQHLQKSGVQLSDNDEVHSFLKEHFLHWLEALSWMQKVSEGIHAISSLKSMAQDGDCPELYAFVHDMRRFTLYSRSAIVQAPLQVYCSALFFAPAMSVVKRHFVGVEPQWMKRPPMVEGEWSALLQTLEGHSGWPNTVAFSLDSKMLASASRNETVKIWDAGTGAELQTFNGYSDAKTLTFLPDGKLVVLTVNKKIIRLCDVSTGAVLQTIKDQSSNFGVVALSPDSKVLAASRSLDGTIKLWDTSTGVLKQNLGPYSSSAGLMTFSPDSKVLVSALRDKITQVWDTDTGAVLQTFHDHQDYINAVAISPDGKVLASALEDNTVKLWNVSTGTELCTLEGHSDDVVAVAFSPDGKVLASASWDKMVKLWDAVTGEVLQTLEGHSGGVGVVAFSPDSKQLASTSWDNTIKLWDVGTGVLRKPPEGHSVSVTAVVFSPDRKVLASASWDKTVKLWDPSTGVVLQTLTGHSNGIKSLVFSPDSKVLASASHDETVKLWDVGTGAELQTLEGHIYSVMAMAFSPDGKVLASTSWDKTIKLWDVSTGTLLRTLDGNPYYASAVAFSPDGKVLASSASNDKRIKLWDVDSGTELKVLKTFKTNFLHVTALAFSADGKLLASAIGNRTIHLLDVDTGEDKQIIEVDSDISTLSFSADGSLIKTDRGAFCTTLFYQKSSSPQGKSAAITVGDQWIAFEDRKMLWLPSEHRPICSAVNGNIVALGGASGRLLVLEFTFFSHFL